MQDSIKEFYKDIIRLEDKYSLSYEDIFRILKKSETCVPISIFNEKLGSFESIVKFLREEKGLTYKEISYLTGRNVQPIRTTYLRAAKKLPGKLDIKSHLEIPIKILRDSRFSILENLVLYLHDSGFIYQEISKMLKRDYQTIWTIAQRIKKR